MKSRAALFILPVTLLLAAGACRDNRASVQIQAVCVPTDNCEFSATCDLQYIGFTALDADTAGARVHLFLQVANQLADNADSQRGKLNTNDAHLDQVSVEYEGIGLPKDVYDLPNYRVPAEGTAVVSAEVYRPVGSNATTLAAAATPGTVRDMVANLRFRGYFDDGSRFETGEFPIGIRVCNGCLPADPCPGEQACPGVVGMEPVSCGTAQ